MMRREGWRRSDDRKAVGIRGRQQKGKYSSGDQGIPTEIRREQKATNTEIEIRHTHQTKIHTTRTRRQIRQMLIFQSSTVAFVVQQQYQQISLLNTEHTVQYVYVILEHVRLSMVHA